MRAKRKDEFNVTYEMARRSPYGIQRLHQKLQRMGFEVRDIDMSARSDDALYITYRRDGQKVCLFQSPNGQRWVYIDDDNLYKKLERPLRLGAQLIG